MKLRVLCIFVLPLLIFSRESYKLYDDSEVATIMIEVAPEDLQWMYENVQSDSLHEATVHFKNAYIDSTIEQVGFRLRGNTSRDSQKKSFKLSFNEFVPGREFYDVDKMNLNGEHNDPSIIRSKIAWDHYQKIGMVAPRAAHCAVYINFVYYGLYISVEHIDDEFLKTNFADDSGNLWKCLYPADLSYRGPDPADYYPYAGNEKPYELKTNESEYDFSQLAHLIKIINQTPQADFKDSIEKVLFVPEVLKYAAMNVLMGNWDDYWFLKNNFYLYHEPSSNRFHWIPYDYDNNYGIDWFNTDWTNVNPYTYKTIDGGSRPLMEKIMAEDQYRDLYSHFLEFFLERVMVLSLWEADLDTLRERIAPWAANDYYRTLDYNFDLTDFAQSYSLNSYSNQHVKNGLKQFVNLRNASLPGQLEWNASPPIIYELDYWPRNPGPDDSIYVQAAVFSHDGIKKLDIAFQPGDLTVVESYPMHFAPIEASTIVEEADRWLGIIPPLGALGAGHFQLAAEDMLGRTMLYPRGDFVSVSVVDADMNKLVINEILSKNDNANVDEAGDHDDWLEIYNYGNEALNLSGMYLTDNPSNLTKWKFPMDDIVLAAHDYLLVWCDEDQEQPGLHTNFKLSADGEFIALTGIDGASIYDSLTFIPLAADVSYGRIPDGSDTWEIMMEPTPGASNTPDATSPELLLPANFRLNNYPNPFNAETIIHYDLPSDSEVRMSIFDMRGKQIVELVSGSQERGQHQITWKAVDKVQRLVPAGIYIIKIQVDGIDDARKILLLK
ncbi:MAG: CotH kinase family protein [Candidatus Marinimicrobia bacterium]|nr:CotH kinase family protein [Candidatus Neomarinimicrobiota bacterium]